MIKRTAATRARAGLSALAVSALLAACGSSSSSSSQSSSASSSATPAAASSNPAAAMGHVKVAITNYAFRPASLTVGAGTKVAFTNHDQTAHTATGHYGAFDTGTIKPGQTATVTLEKPGTYTYYCQFHAFMTATIVVK